MGLSASSMLTVAAAGSVVLASTLLPSHSSLLDKVGNWAAWGTLLGCFWSLLYLELLLADFLGLHWLIPTREGSLRVNCLPLGPLWWPRNAAMVCSQDPLR